jgi:hypothetical protein
MSNIYSQLAKFQQEVGTINKDSKGYGYNYASLDNIVAIIIPLLKENGLGFTHTFEGTDIICTLFNTEGETITSRLSLPQENLKGMNASQSMGANITYAKRYTISAILGLVTDEDTDGVANTPTANQNSSQGQNLAPSSTTEKKIWFSLYTKDGQPIQKHINWVIKTAQEGYTVDQIVKAQEEAGKSIYTTTLEQIKKIVQKNAGSNEVIIQDDDIELEEIPF